MTISLDSDRALENRAEDHFGFVGMAKRLAPSILKASKGDGMVVGLEGRWGSGKTSFLNFLRDELATGEADNIYTITIAPWLNGDSASLVVSLLGPISEVLEAKELEQAKDDSFLRKLKLKKQKVAQIAEMLRTYGQQTARRLAPLASLAGYVVPGGQVAADALGAGAAALEQFAGKDSTPSELKSAIAERIKALDVGFVVIVDDLDRLEPAQAVEVVRLVRSVADFPKVAYLMCYDRAVLAQALKTGLKVKDGDLFLQKIVQLTFAIPLPEPFDLRAQFRKEAEAIFAEVTGAAAEGELLDDLASAVDLEGMGLRTPREVKLALNGIRFVYPSVAEDVYFPDLCRLHLIKVTNFKLYKWLEDYLSVRSILVTGDGTLTKGPRAKMGKELKKIMPANEVSSPRSIWHLTNFIPGVTNHEEAEKRVFSYVSMNAARESIGLKRLGSPLHYRFYFALTGPKTVMPDEEFNDLLRLAREGTPEFKSRLVDYASTARQSGKTWFEHILDRLDDGAIAELDADTASGFILAISDIMDKVMATGNKPRPFAVSVDKTAVRVVGSCLQRLAVLDRPRHDASAKRIAQEGQAINWLVGRFFRFEVRKHGRLGDRQEPQDELIFSAELLDELIVILKARIEDPATHRSIEDLPDVSTYLFGWRDIIGDDGPKAWVAEISESDSGFLRILNHLRSWAISDRVYNPLHKSEVSAFMDYDAAVKRLAALQDGVHDELVRELQTALEQAD